MNLCEEYTVKDEILVNYTEKGKQVMILDLGVPVSLAGKSWTTQYLQDHDMKMENLKKTECEQVFKFGPSKRYVSTEMVEMRAYISKKNGW